MIKPAFGNLFLTECVAMERAMFVIGDNHGACSSYYTYDARFDLIYVGSLLRLL